MNLMVQVYHYGFANQLPSANNNANGDWNTENVTETPKKIKLKIYIYNCSDT